MPYEIYIFIEDSKLHLDQSCEPPVNYIYDSALAAPKEKTERLEAFSPAK